MLTFNDELLKRETDSFETGDVSQSCGGISLHQIPALDQPWKLKLLKKKKKYEEEILIGTEAQDLEGLQKEEFRRRCEINRGMFQGKD